MTTQQTDRELLELAARAAGYALKWGDVYVVGDDEVDCTDLSYVVSGQPDEADWHWAPLDDDGDALRLAVKLRLSIDHNHPADQQPWVAADRQGCEGCYSPVSCVEDDFEESQRPEATRRAIVRAAAQIGRAMP